MTTNPKARDRMRAIIDNKQEVNDMPDNQNSSDWVTVPKVPTPKSEPIHIFDDLLRIRGSAWSPMPTRRP